MKIRPVVSGDAAALAAIYAPHVRDSAVSFEYDAPGAEEMAARISTYTARFPWLVAEEDGHVLGYAYATPYRERKAYQFSCESSVYVAEGCHQRGIASALYTALFDQLQQRGMRWVYAVITLPNEPSERFHARQGFSSFAIFKKTGFKFGQWHDVLWMEKQLPPFDREA